MQGLSTGTEIAILVVFFLFVGGVGYFRFKLDAALAAMPPGVRDHLGIEGQGGSPKRRRRALADRLTIYGLPDWVPLSREGRQALRSLRLLMLGFLAALALGPALAFLNVWGLITLPLVLAVVGVRAIEVGPWPEAPLAGHGHG